MRIKVVPGASRSSIDGWLGDTLKVRVTAPPERGKANAAVERLLAETLRIPRGNARVISGHTATRKVLELDGVSESDLRSRLLESDA